MNGAMLEATLQDRAIEMHSGRVEYSPDAPVRNMTLAREGVEHGK